MSARRESAVASATPRPGSPAAELAAKPGLRMRPYRPVRALAGAFIVVASVVAAITLYLRLGDRTEVLAVNRTVLAGEQITAADLEVVSIASDDHIAFVRAADRPLVVGQYARVRLAAASLLVSESLQPDQLVDPRRVLMSVEVPSGQVPVGLREQSRLVLVVTPGNVTVVDRAAPVLVEAVVAAVPRNLADLVGGGDVQSMVALSVEVPPEFVALVGSADAVSLGVLDASAPFPASAPTSAAVTSLLTTAVSPAAGAAPPSASATTDGVTTTTGTNVTSTTAAAG